MNSERQKIFDILVACAKDVGIDPVRQGCEMFVKAGTRVHTEATKRSPTPRNWTITLWRKQNGICARCKNRQPVPLSDATFDHIVPLAEGGEHVRKNGRMVHRSCNASKGANSPLKESKKIGQLLSEIFPEESEENENIP